jgi:3alpha(or 20beta)-hydroxysteroid dehydrogenase
VGRLEGKVAIISGAARGQGEAHARAFVAEGARVALGDVLDDRCAAVVASLGDAALGLHLDVRDENRWAAAVDATLDRFGRLDVLVNNAGILRHGPLVETSLDSYREVVEVNQVGCFLGMRAVIPTMTAAGGGSIVNTSSAVGLEGGPGIVAYAASKAAVRSMTETAAIELGPLGIRVNSIHPGGVDTEMIRPENIEGVVRHTAEGGPGDRDPGMFSRLPLRRLARPEEISPLAVFLASDESSYCTGGAFVVDGGQTAGNPLH